MSKPMVLCISRSALSEQGIPHNAENIYSFNLNQVKEEDFHFINRKVVDNKDYEPYQDIGYELPQILPYILITDGNGKYLSYSRNGTETRLHGSRSIGIGGHVDIDDTDFEGNQVNIPNTINYAAERELEEEILFEHGLYLTSYKFHFNKLIVDTSNPVGKVHVGLFTTLVYPDAQPQEELHDPQWLTIDELKANIDDYENWSKLVIESL